MNNPKISVIIPTYNRRDMLCQCVDSILAQTYENKEIIIVDDCSTDGTGETVAQKYGDKVAYVRNSENMGCSYNRRLGFEKTDGELVVFMDDDDYYTDSAFFEKAVNTHSDNLSFVGANAVVRYEADGRTKDEKLNVSGHISGRDYLSGFMLTKGKPHSTFTSVFSRQKLIESGIYDMKTVNDASIYMRAMLSGDAYILDDFIGVYRMHGKNISYDLSVDFLIDNLDEKRIIADEIKRRSLFDGEDEWLYRHFILTAQYFINGRGRTKQDIAALSKWCRENLGAYTDRAIDEINRRYRKRKLRNAAKKVKSIFKGK